MIGVSDELVLEAQRMLAKGGIQTTREELRPGWHRCIGPDCLRQIPTSLSFCGEHWKMVPQRQRWDIWRTYKADGGAYTSAHISALEEAVRFVTKEVERRKAFHVG